MLVKEISKKLYKPQKIRIMKKQEMFWKVDIKVPFSKKSQILETMELLGLKIKQKSLVDLSGINRLGIKDILFPGEKRIDTSQQEEKTLSDRVMEFLVCGYQLADHFLSNEENIPSSWSNVDNFIFGDIFENQHKIEFMLVYLRKEKQCKFFPIPEIFIPRSDFCFVCYESKIELEN